jgi:hypothetical protein
MSGCMLVRWSCARAVSFRIYREMSLLYQYLAGLVISDERMHAGGSRCRYPGISVDGGARASVGAARVPLVSESSTRCLCFI